MELIKEIETIEKKLEAIDKNPIEQNPENKRNKGTTVDMEDIPEDKKNDDIVEDKGYKYVKKEMSSTIKSFNETLDIVEPMKERRVYISDPFEAPPGANVQVGAHGGYYYEADSEQKSDDMQKDEQKDKDKKKKDSDKKDLAKPKN